MAERKTKKEAGKDEAAKADEPNEAEEQEKAKPSGEQIEQMIRQHVGFSMVAGALPLPLIDVIAITAIQIDMLKQLAKEYNVDFSEERGKSIVASIMGATLGTFLGRVGASAVKAVPGIGWLLGIGSQVILAGASTYAIGKAFQSHFEENGTFFNVDLDKMKAQFRSLFEKGKDVAEKMKNDQSEDEIMATIEKLKKLKDSGAITEKEFESSKKELLDKLTR